MSAKYTNLINAVPPEPPVIVNRNVIVTQPDVAMFVCTAMARPRPSISWYRLETDNTHTLLPGDEEGVSVTFGDGDTERTRNSTLLFSPTRPVFSAAYICEASNIVDSAEIDVTLMVYGEY